MTIPLNCPITDLPTKGGQWDRDGFSYQIDFLGELHTFYFCTECYKKIDFDQCKYILAGLLANGKLKELEGKLIHWEWDRERDLDAKDGIDLKKILAEANYPKDANRLDNLLVQLHRLPKFDGETVDLDAAATIRLTSLCYFKNRREFIFYINTLQKQGMLEVLTMTAAGFTFKFTFAGLSEVHRLSREGENSKSCFIAMSFDPEVPGLREAIKVALERTGYEPVIINEKNIASDQTLPDAIIAAIRKSKFCIADFSFHKNGVYFEAGFAIGLGRPVIYICERKEFEKTHFDVKQLQHILYSSVQDLEEGLVRKIEAWI